MRTPLFLAAAIALAVAFKTVNFKIFLPNGGFNGGGFDFFSPGILAYRVDRGRLASQAV